MVKHPPANIGDIRDVGSILGLGRSLGGGYDNPLQYSCLENPMDRGPYIHYFIWWVQDMNEWYARHESSAITCPVLQS